MGFSINTVVSDGVTKQFAVSFSNGIYDRDHVFVHVEDDIDGNGAQRERAFTWITDGIIELDVAAPADKKVSIIRSMSRELPDVDYVNGAILDESNLNQSLDQLLGLIQEIFDGRGISEFNSDLAMNGYRITDYGTASESGDLITLGQVQNMLAELGSFNAVIQEESQTGADVVGLTTTLQQISFTPGVRNLLVFLNGNKQKIGRDYLENSDNSITWQKPIADVDDIDCISNVSTVGLVYNYSKSFDVQSDTALSKAFTLPENSSAEVTLVYTCGAGTSAHVVRKSILTLGDASGEDLETTLSSVTGSGGTLSITPTFSVNTWTIQISKGVGSGSSDGTLTIQINTPHGVQEI